GGADFDPTGCSDAEIMRFCQSFMLELHRHIQPDIDVPAGDINVGAREIGYLFGAYKRITNEFEGVLTGKGLSFGGSEMRTEATGFGVIYFLHEILKQAGASIEDQTVVISGAGNVATFAAQKAVDLGARVVTLSDSNGFIHDKEGITSEKIQWVRAHKEKPGSSLVAYADEFDAKWHEGKSPWQVECDVALPCATQNELDEDAARTLAGNNCKFVAEGANMPTTAGAKKVFKDAGVLRGPAKAANAGGVAVSGLEISQNRTGRSRSRAEIREDLCEIMKSIHEACLEHGEGEDGIDYARGANIAAFKKVADAMMAQGIG
ncbi:MAG: NADP-specific glutamate dehydrogenase, partial [Anderseniella sp.]|nr:NADP-specific glutamate dehydrogenase [Anderseniella sp.]